MNQKKGKTMFRAGAVALASCLVFGFSLIPIASAQTKIKAQLPLPQAWGYQPWWMSANWPAVDLGLWKRVVFFELAVEASGKIGDSNTLPHGWQSMGQAAAQCGSALDLAFTLFDEQQFEQLFTSRSSRHTLHHEILRLMKAANAQGVHLDFEIYKRVSDASIEGFRKFVQQLSASLRQEAGARILSVFGVVGAAQDLLDKKTLSSVDFIVVQGYDAHWVGGAASGPVAPIKGSHALTWEKALQHYLQLGAQRSRLLFSIPYFGYEWPTESEVPGSATTGKGSEMTYAPVPAEWVPKIPLSALEQSKRHGILRDAETGSPYYVYRDHNGRWRQGWFEDETSLAEKLAFIKREQLAGVAAFPLGYDAGKIDPLIADAFGKRPRCHPGDSTK